MSLDQHGTPSLRASGKRWGVAAICIGVGQGLAVVVENLGA
jgi:acetyl-CoA acetyltransferase